MLVKPRPILTKIFLNNMQPLHVGISVNNLQESIKWYQNVLDFELKWSRDFAELQAKIAFLKNKTEFEIELFEHYDSVKIPDARLQPKEDIKTQGTKHIAFGVENITKLFDDFKTKKVDIVFGPIESPPKDALFGFIRDPSGVLIEFIEKIK
jgi:methylmalonyl-CoA/ethylmalonyl-CoA epimerase